MLRKLKTQILIGFIITMMLSQSILITFDSLSMRDYSKETIDSVVKLDLMQTKYFIGRLFAEKTTLLNEQLFYLNQNIETHIDTLHHEMIFATDKISGKGETYIVKNYLSKAIDFLDKSELLSHLKKQDIACELYTKTDNGYVEIFNTASIDSKFYFYNQYTDFIRNIESKGNVIRSYNQNGTIYVEAIHRIKKIILRSDLLGYIAKC